MFALRGIAVSSSVFVLVYCVLSFAVSITWRRIQLWAQHDPVHRIADMLFVLRMFPLASAALITAAFTVPSFVLLEPRAIDEPIGAVPLTLGICGASLAIFGLVNAAAAMIRASRAISTWTAEAQPVEPAAPLPVLRISRVTPAMTAVGILRPKVLVSSAAEVVLSGEELHAALNHEVAHARRRDNLKKLFLCFVAFPGMRSLELAWLETTEMAADDAAVSSAGEALDLASALIKLSRLGPVEAPVNLTAAIVHNPASIMNTRVERLICWTEARRVPDRGGSLWYGVAAAAAAVALFAFTYSQLLTRVHTATEWLVR